MNTFHSKPSNPGRLPAAASCAKGRGIAGRSRAPAAVFGMRGPEIPLRPSDPARLFEGWARCPSIAVLPKLKHFTLESESPSNRAECPANSPAWLLAAKNGQPRFAGGRLGW